MTQRRYLWWPITLGVVMIVLLVALTVGWILITVLANEENSGVYWVLLAVGTVFLVLVLVGVVLYLVLAVKEIRLNNRQSNFIDSVTHELKSPIASLKLYLQTLARHNVTEEQRATFQRIMLEDLERLDTLINHLLDTARLDQGPIQEDLVDNDLSELLRRCAESACLRYRLSCDAVRLDLAPAIVVAQPIDLEMVFRNLIDNAIKYSGNEPQVRIESRFDARGMVVIRVIDNGPGIPVGERRRIFRRFVRLGSELERSQTGTGLGLYIVRMLVRRLKGKITVGGRGGERGTVFEVELPGSSPNPKSQIPNPNSSEASADPTSREAPAEPAPSAAPSPKSQIPNPDLATSR